MLISHIDPKIFYSLIIGPFLLVWIVLLVFSARTRREQLEMSAMFSFLGAFFDSIFYFTDYWRPQSILSFHLGSVTVCFESFVYGALFGGIVAVVYQRSAGLGVDTRESAGMWNRFLLCMGLFFLVSLAFWHVGLNSIYATVLGALAITTACVIYRRDLMAPALVSGIAAAGIMFIFYLLIFALVGNAREIFSNPTWLLSGGPLDYKIASVPITELIWGFCAGSTVGVFYKFIRNAYLV